MNQAQKTISNHQTRIGPIRQLVIQATPFCNLDCSYCYLPDRTSTSRMSFETMSLICRNILRPEFIDDEIEIRWHAGEPLAVPISFYDEAFSEIKKYTPESCKIAHSLQTNGTLVNQNWCDFIKRHSIRIGLSLDGPAFLHDRFRKTRGGKNTFKKILDAVRLFQQNNIPFEVIAVLTSESLNHPEMIYRFFEELGVQRLNFNTEETEGINISQTYRAVDIVERYRKFMQEVFTLFISGPVRIREFEEILNFIQSKDKTRHNLLTTPFNIISIDYEGNISTFSPELLGMRTTHYGHFLYGNLKDNSLFELKYNDHYRRIANDIADGVKNCSNQCDYFSICGGGSPSNKLFETGAFSSTETMFCKMKIKIIVDIVVQYLEAKGGSRNDANFN